VVYGAALEKRSPIISERGFESHPLRGEVLEWSNRHAWRACVGFSRPWVRIPPSPPITSRRSKWGNEQSLAIPQGTARLCSKLIAELAARCEIMAAG
jgi:hypothetical protein